MGVYGHLSIFYSCVMIRIRIGVLESPESYAPTIIFTIMTGRVLYMEIDEVFININH